MKSAERSAKHRISANPMLEVFDLIGSVARRMDRLEAQALAEADLTAAQYMILANLHEKDARPLGELADVMRCSRSTITGVVDTMERKGLVAREANPGDRRSRLLRLTAKGKAVRRSNPELEAFFEECGPCMERGEFQRLRDLLARLDRSMSAIERGA